jgi:membrane dipeptidase
MQSSNFYRLGNDVKNHILRLSFFLIAIAVSGQPLWAETKPDAAALARATKVLERTPVIDGHNDLPWELHDKFGDSAPLVDIVGTAGTPITKQQTDIKRMRVGRMGGQFWSVWIPSTVTGADAVKLTLEQIDVARSFTRNNPSVFAEAQTAADIERIQQSGKIAALIGIEGGHQIGDSVPALRQFYSLGARYMTLTHSNNNALADSATDNPKHNGLSPFGRQVIEEMNRLGMLVDLSHVSPDTMRQAIALSKAPVIFSHSGARAIAEHPRNVPDDVIQSLKARDGVVMVNFYSGYVSNTYSKWNADRGAEIARFNAPPFGGLFIGQPERAAEALAAWDKAHPKPIVTVGDVADHLDHIVKVAGIDHVGIGSDFDGVDGETPAGLKSVADYPNLFAELIRREWTDQMLAKLAGGNILRVMRGAEKVAGSPVK